MKGKTARLLRKQAEVIVPKDRTYTSYEHFETTNKGRKNCYKDLKTMLKNGSIGVSKSGSK